MILIVNDIIIMLIIFRMDLHLFILLLGTIVKNVWSYYIPMELMLI